MPVARVGQTNRGEVQRKAAGHEDRQLRDGLGADGGLQDVPAQIEEPRQLVPPGRGFASPGASRGREIAGDDTDREEGEQRDPVPRIGDVEVPRGGMK